MDAMTSCLQNKTEPQQGIQMRVAIIHDWLVTYAGAERVLEQMLHVYPDADLFSIVDFLPEGSATSSRINLCRPLSSSGCLLRKSATGSSCRSCPSRWSSSTCHATTWCCQVRTPSPKGSSPDLTSFTSRTCIRRFATFGICSISTCGRRTWREGSKVGRRVICSTVCGFGTAARRTGWITSSPIRSSSRGASGRSIGARRR